MNEFLKSVERRAFLMVRMATSTDDDALKVVEEAMTRMIGLHRDRQESEWKLLFFQILEDGLADWLRHQNRWKRLVFWRCHLSEVSSCHPVTSACEADSPATNHYVTERHQQLLVAQLRQLPLLHQQFFLLRRLAGLSTAESARVLGISGNALKTCMAAVRQSLSASAEQAAPLTDSTSEKRRERRQDLLLREYLKWQESGLERQLRDQLASRRAYAFRQALHQYPRAALQPGKRRGWTIATVLLLGLLWWSQPFEQEQFVSEQEETANMFAEAIPQWQDALLLSGLHQVRRGVIQPSGFAAWLSGLPAARSTGDGWRAFQSMAVTPQSLRQPVVQVSSPARVRE